MGKYPNDAARPLTASGRRETKRMARTLRRRKAPFDKIVSSPLARARQTAEIVAATYRRKVVFTQHLQPEGDLRSLVQQLRRIAGRARSVLLVGHEPSMSTLISMLLSGGKTLKIRLKKGGLCRLTVESLKYGKCARLDWLLTPRQLGGK